MRNSISRGHSAKMTIPWVSHLYKGTEESFLPSSANDLSSMFIIHSCSCDFLQYTVTVHSWGLS